MRTWYTESIPRTNHSLPILSSRRPQIQLRCRRRRQSTPCLRMAGEFTKFKFDDFTTKYIDLANKKVDYENVECNQQAWGEIVQETRQIHVSSPIFAGIQCSNAWMVLGWKSLSCFGLWMLNPAVTIWNPTQLGLLWRGKTEGNPGVRMEEPFVNPSVLMNMRQSHHFEITQAWNSHSTLVQHYRCPD